MEKCGSSAFQKLLFLVRDWSSTMDHAYGASGGKAYIDDVLKVIL
jgi:hypothetical protein